MLDFLASDMTLPTYAYLFIALTIIVLLACVYRTDKQLFDKANTIEEIEEDYAVLTDVVIDATATIAYLATLVMNKNHELRKRDATIDELSKFVPAETLDDQVTRLSYCSDCCGLRWPEHFAANPDHVVRRLNTEKPDDN